MTTLFSAARCLKIHLLKQEELSCVRQLFEEILGRYYAIGNHPIQGAKRVEVS